MRNELVICTNGEQFEACGDNDRGVEFDGGTIPWNEVEGFKCWNPATESWMFVPV